MMKLLPGLGYDIVTGIGFLKQILDSSRTVKAFDTTSSAYITVNSSADGDIYQIPIMAEGTETKLNLRLKKSTSDGKIDVYINGVLDTSAIDLYASSSEFLKVITLTQKVGVGYNLIELRVNGKNTSSSGYYVRFYGAFLSN